MAIDTFKNKTTNELKNSVQALKVTTIALTIVVVLLLSLTIYGLLTKDDKSTNWALLAVGISCGSMIPIQLMSMKKMKDEINSRES